MPYPPLIGLTGPARSGKNTVADHLCGRYGYRRMAFSDALYEEVATAFSLDEAFLRDSRTKDAPSPRMALRNSSNIEFNSVAIDEIDREYRASVGDVLWGVWAEPLSPRQVLQWWGTEYRRAQDPDYWVKKLSDRYAEYLASLTFYSPVPGLESRVVVDGFRYPNEVRWLRGHPGSELWHLKRDLPPVAGHSSEVPVKWERLDSVLRNDGTIADLNLKVDRMMAHREKR